MRFHTNVIQKEGPLLFCNRLALWASNAEGSSLFTTASDRAFANDICLGEKFS